MRLMTSDSANTVHMELMVMGFPRDARSESSSMVSPRRLVMTSRNFPVPAEHLSFMMNFMTRPFFKAIPLVSWPPMSMTVPFLPNRCQAPFPWQVISVTDLSA